MTDILQVSLHEGSNRQLHERAIRVSIKEVQDGEHGCLTFEKLLRHVESCLTLSDNVKLQISDSEHSSVYLAQSNTGPGGTCNISDNVQEHVDACGGNNWRVKFLFKFRPQHPPPGATPGATSGGANAFSLMMMSPNISTLPKPYGSSRTPPPHWAATSPQ